MRNETKSSRFQALRRLEQEHTLSVAEQTELRDLISELDEVEAAVLTPATQRLRANREIIEQQNNALKELVQRKEALAARLRAFLTESQATRRAIDSELAAILNR